MIVGLIVFGGQVLQLGLTGRLQPLELLAFLVVAVAQILELSAHRVERLPQRLTFDLDVPDRALALGEATLVNVALDVELRLQAGPVVHRPPAERRSGLEKPAPTARELGARLGQLALDTGAPLRLTSEVVLERLLAGAGGLPFRLASLFGLLRRT